MDPLVIAGRSFQSRLIVGTGKYPSNPVMVLAHEASGAEMVTVAVRRVNISDRSRESLLDYIDIGVTTILIRGYDPYDDAIDYGRFLLPLVREEVARRDAEKQAVSA